MTERIKELANKAGYNDQIYEISKEGLDRFAELIVQECAELVDWAIGDKILVGTIKQHFGVTE